MTDVANHINEVQRQNEDRHYLQDIQALLLNYDGPELTRLGEFCMEGEVYQGKNQERYILLFHKLFILLKWHHDRLEVRHQIATDNLIVLEGEDRAFQVTPFDDIKNKVLFSIIDLESKRSLDLFDDKNNWGEEAVVPPPKTVNDGEPSGTGPSLGKVENFEWWVEILFDFFKNFNEKKSR